MWRKLPIPADRTLYLIVDKTLVEKTGKKHPYNRKTKTGYTNNKWQYGFYVIILLAHWGPYRFPIDFALVTPKDYPGHKTPNQLFVEMFENFRPPKWAKQVIVLSDCEYAAKITLRAIIRRGKQAKITGVHYFFVISFPRTWKLEGETNSGVKAQKIKDIVKYLPYYRYRKTWFKQINGRRKYFWIYSRKARLSGVGDVTMVVSKKRRNSSPHKAKILVTNIPNVAASEVVRIYRRRWYAEVLNHELKSACGLGHHQVTKYPQRIQRSVALSMIAYLTMLRFQADEIRPHEHWSMNRLKYSFALRIFQEQSESKIWRRRRKKAA